MKTSVSNAFKDYLVLSNDKTWYQDLELYLGTPDNVEDLQTTFGFNKELNSSKMKKISDVVIEINAPESDYTLDSYEKFFDIPCASTNNGIFKNWYIGETSDSDLHYDHEKYIFNNIDEHRLSSTVLHVYPYRDVIECSINITLNNEDKKKEKTGETTIQYFEVIPEYMVLTTNSVPFILYNLENKLVFTEKFNINWNMNGLLEIE
jgi:hypothetical protein